MHSPSFLGLSQGLTSCEYAYLSEDHGVDYRRRSDASDADAGKLYRHNSVSESLCGRGLQGKKDHKVPRGSWTPLLRTKHSSISDIAGSSPSKDDLAGSPSKASQLLARFRRSSSSLSSALDLRASSRSHDGNANRSSANGGSDLTRTASQKRPLRSRLFRHISWTNVEHKQSCDIAGAGCPSPKSSLTLLDDDHISCESYHVTNGCENGCSKDSPQPCPGCKKNVTANSPNCKCKPPKPQNPRSKSHEKSNGKTTPTKVRLRHSSGNSTGSNPGSSPSKLTPVKDILRRFSLRYRRKHDLEKEDMLLDKPRPHSFVNSQEWTLARAVPDLKLGILGTTNSGKSALVHRYLTGSYMQDESPEGGRFKKEVILDTQSYLLLIRDEGGPPEMQFTNWVDAVICVFSVENEMSFNAIYTYYTKMAHYRNLNEIPVILVGTQDAISESNPRVIDDTRARKLANDLKRCSYYETCATYGLNVERVFQDACQKVVQLRMTPITPTNSRPSTPNHSNVRGYYAQNTPTTKGYDTHSSSGQSTSGSGTAVTAATTTAAIQNVQGHSPPFREQATPPQTVPTHSTATSGRSEDKKKDKKRDKERERQLEREREQATMQAMIQSQLQGHSQSQGQGQQGQYHYQHHQEGPTLGHKHGPASIPLPPPTTAPPPPPTSGPGAGIDQIHPQSQQEMFQLQQQLQQFQQQQQQQQQQANQVLDFRDMSTPSSTPVPTRKNKNHTVQKSNSFSGSAILHRASLQSGDHPDPDILITRTPQPARKSKNTKSLSPDTGPDGQTAGLTPLMSRKEPRYRFSLIVDKMDTFLRELQIPRDSPLTPILSRIPRVRSSLSLDHSYDYPDIATPSSTPTPGRKNRRRSNLFSQKKGDEEKKQKNGEMVGSGRVIPIKQGYLYKKSAKPLSKDWKKKYVTLLDDGRLTYHPSLHDYMDDVHGKEIRLMRTTVKIPGQKPRGSRTASESLPQQANGNLPAPGGKAKDSVVLTSFDQLRDGPTGPAIKPDESIVIQNSSLQADPDSGILDGMDLVIPGSKIETPNVKKRHKRAKSGAKNLDNSQDGADSDGYEFMIVSIENKQWHFEAPSIEEREEWVTSIEQQILFSLQGIESNKSKSRSNTLTDPAAGQAIRSVKGNQQCADCDANNPDWASLNLGALICIECSGIHRNLGTHVSRVRSLDLDEWPPELVEVMKSMGNQLSNSIWESNTKGRPKPTPTSSREDKEKWIRAKYEQRELLPPPPHPGIPLPQQLIDAVARQHIHDTALVLAHTKLEHVNAPYSGTDTRTALHIAAALGNVVLVQLLLWYGSNVRTVDHEGRNALFYARSSNSPECVELLRNQGCPENPTLPRRRGSSQPSNTQQQSQQQPNSDVFEKLPASVI